MEATVENNVQKWPQKLRGVPPERVVIFQQIRDKNCSKKNLTKKNILLIGDTIHDLEVASALDVDCVLVDIGHVSSKRLKETGVPILRSLASVSNFIDKRC